MHRFTTNTDARLTVLRQKYTDSTRMLGQRYPITSEQAYAVQSVAVLNPAPQALLNWLKLNPKTALAQIGTWHHLLSASKPLWPTCLLVKKELSNLSKRVSSLNLALSVGYDLVESSFVYGRGKTWKVQVTNRHVENEETEIAGGSIYSGSAGIGAFLSQLYGVTGEQVFRKCAEGALRWAHEFYVSQTLPRIGYHDGLAGAGVALLRESRTLECGDLETLGIELLQQVDLRIDHDKSYDLISGAAGAIVGLVEAHELTGNDEFLAIAVKCAKHLLKNKVSLPGGYCWVGSNLFVRPLCGISHGSSGIGLSLVELACRMQDQQLLDVGIGGILYANSQFSSQINNWIDHRHESLGAMRFKYGMASVLGAIREGTVDFSQKVRGMYAWCHGAPGEAIVRARLAQLLGSNLTAYGERAISETRNSITERYGPLNHSQCHGGLGNADSLLLCGTLLEDSELQVSSRELISEIAEEVSTSTRSFVSGVYGGRKEPSLMIGAAGSGLTMLRDHSPSVWSPLWPLRSKVSTQSINWAKLHAEGARERIIRDVLPELGKLGDEDLQALFASSSSGEIAEVTVTEGQLRVAPNIPQLALARVALLGERLSLLDDLRLQALSVNHNPVDSQGNYAVSGQVLILSSAEDLVRKVTSNPMQTEQIFVRTQLKVEEKDLNSFSALILSLHSHPVAEDTLKLLIETLLHEAEPREQLLETAIAHRKLLIDSKLLLPA